MKWEDTIAYSCRYGDEAKLAFKDATIIWENSEADYQGYANIFGKLPNGKFFHYEWSYGSCSGCDEWESAGLSGKEIVKTMQEAAVYFDNVDTVKRYFNLDEELTKGKDFPVMGKAFLEWLEKD